MIVFDNKPYTLDRVVRLALTVGLLWGIIWLLGYLSDVLIPFAIAVLLAYLINPLVLFIKGKVRNHILAVFISLILVAIAIILLTLLVVPMIVNQISHMGTVFSGLVTNSEVAERAAQYLPPDIWQAIKDFLIKEDIQDFFKTERFFEMVETGARKLLPGVWGLITGTTSFLMGIFGLALIVLYLVFLLIDYKKVKEGWKDLIPPAHREWILAFVNDFNDGMNRYFRGQAAVASIVGLLFAVGFTIIGLPMGILLGLLVGLLNMVPYLQTLGIPPALLLAMVRAIETGNSIWLMLGLTLLIFGVVQLIQDAILVPRIMGSATGLSPAVILLSLSIWGKLLGMFGLVIALPMTALLVAYYRRLLATSQQPLPEPNEAAEPS